MLFYNGLPLYFEAILHNSVFHVFQAAVMYPKKGVDEHGKSHDIVNYGVWKQGILHETCLWVYREVWYNLREPHGKVVYNNT